MPDNPLRELADEYAELSAELDRRDALRRALTLLVAESDVAWSAWPTDADSLEIEDPRDNGNFGDRELNRVSTVAAQAALQFSLPDLGIRVIVNLPRRRSIAADWRIAVAGPHGLGEFGPQVGPVRNTVVWRELDAASTPL
jgi:hypothetical protein